MTLDFVGFIRTAEVDLPDSRHRYVTGKGAKLCCQRCVCRGKIQIRNVGLADFSRIRVNFIGRLKAREGRCASGRCLKLNGD